MVAGLVADIGSTNARFALAQVGPEGVPTLSETAVLPCRDFATLEAAMTRYLGGLPAGALPRRATLAVAAPVTGDRIALTNNPWRFQISDLRARFGFDHLSVINDFTAVSLSLLKLPEDATISVGPTADLRCTKVIGAIGPGSGLGVGGLISHGGATLPIPSEGGHMNFAPQTEREWAIAGRLAARFGHVSNERLLSGPGLVNIYASLHEIDRSSPAPLHAPDIVARALGDEDPVCREALDLFCAVLGSAAGDLALLLYAEAVFIAGGIVPRFVDFLTRSEFRTRFEAKGRYAAHLAGVPTLVVTEKYAGLVGAAVQLSQGADI